LATEGLYAAASGLTAQQARMDAIASDMANLQTPAYRRERLSFQEVMDAGGRAAGVATTWTGLSVVDGELQQSDNPLAVGIRGDGFFQVQLGPGRIGLTRAGDFQIDARGSLVTGSGLRVVPPITVPAGTKPTDVQIGPDGSVEVAGKKIGQITLVRVPNPGALDELDGGVLVPTTGSGRPSVVTRSQLVQGSLEGSDVDMGESLVGLIDAQRSFQLSSKALQTQDQLLQIANELKQ